MCADCLTTIFLNKLGLKDTPSFRDTLSNKVALDVREYADLVAFTGQQAVVKTDRFTREVCPWLNKYITVIFSSDLMLTAKEHIFLPDTKLSFIIMTTALLQDYSEKLYNKKRAEIFM